MECYFVNFVQPYFLISRTYSSMAFTINPKSAGNLHYIHIEFTGQLTLQLRKEAFEISKTYIHTNGIKRAVWDISKANAGSGILNTHEIVTELLSLKLPSDLKIVLLGSAQQSITQYAETVAFNRGYTNIKAFTDSEEALRWLAL
ncbi:MAG: hypothetical protein K2X48_01655 [Chitinophagaceae bacterium]|nr:hypothetical protein [Chitinophagaceae bacterium]